MAVFETKMLWHEQSWPRIESIDKRIPVVIPLGSLEQHGKHLPLFVDSIQVDSVAREAEKRLADRMLLFAGGHRVLPMDAGTARVVRRVGYDGAPDEELPHSLDLYRRVSLYLSHHAVSTCTDADPHCAVCPLLHDCPTGQSMR